MKRADANGGKRRNREHEVVDAAIDVFWRKGYSAATIQDVADQVGVLKGSLYHYIDSKEDLLFRIFDQSHRQAEAIAHDAAALGLPPLDELRHYFVSYAAWYLKNLERVSLYVGEWRHLTGDRLEMVKQQRRVTERYVRRLIDGSKEDGSIPDEVNTKYAAFFALGAVNSLPTWYRRDGRDSPARIAATYAEMIVAALQHAQMGSPLP